MDEATIRRLGLELRARQILKQEAEAIKKLQPGASFTDAIMALLKCQRKVVTTGVGKAGLIGRKLAATLCSTTTVAAFLQPSEAAHGDLGLLEPGDVLIAFSNSGKTREVLETVEYGRRLGLKSVIAITAHKDSPLGLLSDIVLELGDVEEACPMGLTPTCSTTCMLALADALAIVLLELKGVDKESFGQRHHGGYLGQKCRITGP